MKEFRHIMMIFALVALAAGCSKVEVVNAPEREISFTVGSYAPATKAVAVTEFTSFKSKGYLYAEGVTGAQDFFGAAGETITFNGTDTWAPSHPYYWPKGESSYINFISWYDNLGAPTTATETALEWVGRTIEANDNIMFADVAWHYNGNASTYRFNNVANGVPTLFHHALSRVQINLRSTVATQDNKTYEVSIQSAVLEGVYRRGNMRLTNTELSTTGTSAWVSNNATYLWSTSSGSNADSYTLVTDTDITTTNTAIMPLRSFLPQALGGGIKLTLTYTVTTKSGGNIVSSEDGIVSSVILNSVKNSSNVEITQWLPNRKYIYNFAINPIGQDILLNPTIESDWGFNDLSVTVE